jgi:hypothetical protein
VVGAGGGAGGAWWSPTQLHSSILNTPSFSDAKWLNRDRLISSSPQPQVGHSSMTRAMAVLPKAWISCGGFVSRGSTCVSGTYNFLATYGRVGVSSAHGVVLR